MKRFAVAVAVSYLFGWITGRLPAPHDPGEFWISNVGGPYLVIGFLAGAWVSRRRGTDRPGRGGRREARGPGLMTIRLVSRFAVDDRQLSALHARAFGGDPTDVQPWSRRLERHALTWIGAFDAGQLAGFVQVCWDGGSHAFLLDTAVDPERQHHGIGTRLVEAATEEARAAGCEWLHVDFEPHLENFYLNRCNFRPTRAGLVRLTPS